jgi:clan AA aspartic protease
VNGVVDDKLRALLRVPVSASPKGSRTHIVVWIDTAFNGGLVIPRKQIAELGLVQESSAEAILADGHSIELETFACFLDWFGNSYETQIVANDGEFPLLGTTLLDGHRLEIDYTAKTVVLA